MSEIDDLDAKMQAMPVEWRYHWCGGDPRERGGMLGGCACLGCANNSGQLGNSQEAYDRWAAWVATHPKPLPK